MNVRRFFASYALARRATFATVATLLAMLLLAGLTLAALFARDQIEQGRIAALTQANVASSTVVAALRFGGKDVISESLRVFDSGPDPDSAAVYVPSRATTRQTAAPKIAASQWLCRSNSGRARAHCGGKFSTTQVALSMGKPCGSNSATLHSSYSNESTLSARYDCALTAWSCTVTAIATRA